MITGASSGIGRAVAEALARRGAHLVLVARRRRELQEVADSCLEAGAASAVPIQVDITDAEELSGALAATVATRDRVDAVVHAAGVAGYGRFADIPAEVFDRVVGVNVLGAANVARTALRHFEERGTGHLVVVGSILGRATTPFMSPYITSKFGLRGLVRALQAEFRGSDVHIGLIEPGSVGTGIYVKAASYLGVQGKPPKPVKRPDQVADAVTSMLDRPRRSISVGLLNPVQVVGFTVFPSVYDLLVKPLHRRLGLEKAPVGAHAGNVFESTAEPPSKQTLSPVDRKLAEVSRQVDATPSEVWTVLSDGWLYPSWVVGTSRMRDVDPHWPDAGAQLHHSFGVWPLLIDDRTEVLEVEPKRMLKLRAHGWPAGSAEVLIRLEDRDGGTLITMQEVPVQGPATLVPGPAMQAAMIPRNTEALRRLAYVIERR